MLERKAITIGGCPRDEDLKKKTLIISISILDLIQFCFVFLDSYEDIAEHKSFENWCMFLIIFASPETQ